MIPAYKNSVETRSDLMTLLTEACELEHGLACSYLYAAFSLKQDLSEGGMTWKQLHAVKKWAAQLYLVASQEMFHLAQAWNLLNALGGSPYYLRPNFPQRSNYYPFGLPLLLEPFSKSSMKRFIMYELPSHMDEKNYVRSEMGYVNEDLYEYKTVGELYTLIKNGFVKLSSQQDLFIGDPNLQIGEDLIDFPEIVKVTGTEAAVEAIEKIMEQGEGNSIKDVDSHYGIFKQILQEFEAEQKEAGAAFQPVRPAITNPVVHLKGDYRSDRGTYITNEFAAEIADLFDDLYNLMLRSLHFLFSTPGLDNVKQQKLAKFSIAIMPMVIKPLGDGLMLLSAGRLQPGKVAGPAFSMSRHVVLPFSEHAACKVISERFDELLRRSEAASKNSQAPFCSTVSSTEHATIKILFTMINIDLCYYPDITQYRSAGDVRRAVEIFAKDLSQDYGQRINTQVTITVLPVMDVRTQTYYMQDPAKGAGIGLMKPVSYVLANRKNANVVPAAVAWRIIGDVEADTYLGQLFVHKSSGIKSFKDITKLHRIAYGDSFSTSNFLVPAMDLYRNGIHPFTSFRMAKFFGGHDGSAKAVYFLEADIGAGHDGAVTLLAQEKGFEDAAEKLITLSKVDIYSDPVVIRKDLIPDADKLTESMIEISSKPAIKKALEDFWGNVTKLGKPEPEKYLLISEALDALNLSDKDIL